MSKQNEYYDKKIEEIITKTSNHLEKFGRIELVDHKTGARCEGFNQQLVDVFFQALGATILADIVQIDHEDGIPCEGCHGSVHIIAEKAIERHNAGLGLS